MRSHSDTGCLLYFHTAKMEVQIISQSCVPPSSPTPSHLQTYKVSLIDQFLKANYFATILFYQNSQETNTDTQRSSFLKQSLSETLTRFYPFAGKVKDTLTIDCNDEGVSYTEATANISLSEYLGKLDLASLNKLKPNVCLDFELPCGSHIALIQETNFTCGGFSIAIYVSHMIGDASSLYLFIKDWAAATTRNSPVQHPFLKGGSIFRQYPEFPTEASLLTNIYAPFAKKGKHITKRIVFNESGIADLKSKVSSNGVNNPTRTEVVTAILSKCLMASFKNKTGVDTPLAINHVVNFRKKLEPPIPECSVGNYLMPVGAVFTAKNNDLSELVSHIRETIQKVDKEFVKKLSEDGFLKYYDTVKEIRDLYTSPVFASREAEFVAFSSWCNFGTYEIDFGWGKPIWTASTLPFINASDVPSTNLIIFMDTKIGNGVEAWLAIKEDVFDFLKKDPELLQYASIDAPPLFI